MFNGPATDYDASERPGCPVMIANGLYEVNEKWPDVALRMLQDHLTDQSRTCCDEHGFALPFELTSPTEMLCLRPVTVRPVVYKGVA